MMIPLRRAFIVNMHGKPGQPGTLLYPEGTACAEVLISGEKGGTSGATVFIGFGVAFAHKFLTEGMNAAARRRSACRSASSKRRRQVAGDMARELLGVGYIIGARIGVDHDGRRGPRLARRHRPTIYLRQAAEAPAHRRPMSVYKNYLRFIGAGCVAAAGIISMFRTLPMIVRSFRSASASSAATADVAGERPHRPRPAADGRPRRQPAAAGLLTALPAWARSAGSPPSSRSLLVLLFGFLFVTVSSRLTGEIGSSSQPHLAA